LDFRISALPVAPFASLFGLPDRDLAARGVVRRIADQRPGFPCRVSLRDADPGEPVLLLNYEHLAVPGPYRSRHAIYVREHAVECRPDVNEVPDALRIRLLSVRAFAVDGMMVDADVVAGAAVHQLVHRWLDDPRVGYLHLHNAKPGCYAARADRVRPAGAAG
jgi:hypothetical protein